MTDIREKYQKVKALAERGATEGERQAAREALARIKEKYPWLEANEKKPERDGLSADDWLARVIKRQMDQMIKEEFFKAAVRYRGEDTSHWVYKNGRLEKQ